MDGVLNPGPVRQRPRLLVVEDEVSTVFALRSFFTATGSDVDCAANPFEGLRLLDRNEYEAIITDLHLTPLRRAEGLSIAKHARCRNPRACVVMLTAYGSEAIEQEAQQCGVDIYRTKPVELPRLAGDIERVRQEHSDGQQRPAAHGRADQWT